MKRLGVLICLVLAASCGSGAARHRHETRSMPDESDYPEESDAFEDSQIYQQREAFDNDDSVAADNIKTIFGGGRQLQPKRPGSRSQTRCRQNPCSQTELANLRTRQSSRTFVRRTQVQPRAQQPCAPAPTARPHTAFHPPNFPPYGGYPTIPWWPSWGGFPIFPVLYVPVPVCNCSAQGDNGPSAQPEGIGIPPRFGGGDNEVDYDDVEPAPINFEGASTPRPLAFKPPKVNKLNGDGQGQDTSSGDGQNQAPVQGQVSQRPQPGNQPSTIGSSVRQDSMRCARAIVNCCDLQAGAKCFEIFGCEGGFFSDPCDLYDKAITALSKQGNRIK